MSAEITSIVEADELAERVGVARFETVDPQDPIMCANLGGGLLRFARAAFPENDFDEIFAQKYERAEGFGAHFDVYGEHLSVPHLAIYGLSGSAYFKATRIPKTLTDQYYTDHATATAEAHAARRSYADIAFARPDAHIVSGDFNPGDGLLIPQVAGEDVAHEVTPISADGEFIKLLVPKQDEESLSVIDDAGYIPLDLLITEGLESLEATASPPSVELEQPERKFRWLDRLNDRDRSQPLEDAFWDGTDMGGPRRDGLLD